MKPRRKVITRGWASPIRGSNRWMLNVSVEWPSDLTHPNTADAAAERMAVGVAKMLQYAHENNLHVARKTASGADVAAQPVTP